MARTSYQIPIGLEFSQYGYPLIAKISGPNGLYLQHIEQASGAMIFLKVPQPFRWAFLHDLSFVQILALWRRIPISLVTSSLFVSSISIDLGSGLILWRNGAVAHSDHSADASDCRCR